MASNNNSEDSFINPLHYSIISPVWVNQVKTITTITRTTQRVACQTTTKNDVFIMEKVEITEDVEIVEDDILVYDQDATYVPMGLPPFQKAKEI